MGSMCLGVSWCVAWVSKREMIVFLHKVSVVCCGRCEKKNTVHETRMGLFLISEQNRVAKWVTRFLI